jgi:CheY-like chemotaxis protein
MATVLVAEDDPVVLDLLTAVLEEELDARVVAVRDGCAALTALESAGADLVLADAELAEQMRQRDALRAIPIVATSAAPGGEKAMAPWSAAFVAKPFDLDHLIAVVRGHMPDPGHAP